jgi:polyisoprenoid-binding protein YceI
VTWTVDKKASKIGFSIKHMMISTVRGSFSDYDCDLVLDPQDLTSGSVSAKIKVQSVNTGERLRDEFLVSKDFFRPEQFPVMHFQSTGVRARGSKLSLVGKLKIRDKERSVTLEGSVKGPERSRDGGQKMTFLLKTEIERDAFDLNFNSALETGNILVGNKLSISLQISVVES